MSPEIQSPGNSSEGDRKRKAIHMPPNQSRIKKVDAQLKDVVDLMKNVGNKICASKPASQISKSTDVAFGEYIASKLCGYSHNTKCFVQHKINNILFEADMGIYEQPPGQGHTVPMNIITSPQECNTTVGYSSNSSPSLLLSNDEGTQFTIVIF